MQAIHCQSGRVACLPPTTKHGDESVQMAVVVCTVHCWDVDVGAHIQQ